MTVWLADGEKYALIGLSVKTDQSIPLREVRPGFWVWTDQKLDVPEHWREWLGSIRSEQIRNCNLVLLCKMASSTPDVLDGENQELQRSVVAFYRCLLLSSAFTPTHQPILLTGAFCHDQIGIRQESTFELPALNLFRYYPSVFLHEIERAAALAELYIKLVGSALPSGGWRFHRAFSVYLDARITADLMDRLHQYCRCIDGLILSQPGKGRSHFKSRTELFIGPRDQDLLGDIYAVRSDIEHLNEHKYLENFDRAQRLDLVKKEAITEYIARHVLAHVIGTPSLWQHFASNATLAQFWKLTPIVRQKFWGPPTIKTKDALHGYDPTYIHDSSLK